MERLLGFGVLPIVNENDTVSTAELESVSGEQAGGVQRQRPAGGAGDERNGSGRAGTADERGWVLAGRARARSRRRRDICGASHAGD